MIKTKKELNYYLMEDQKANFINKNKIMHFFPPCYITLKAIFLMRKAEFYQGTGRKIFAKIYQKRMEHLCARLGMELHINCFGPGLRIAHPFGIVVSGNAKVGSNCFIHQGVTIGINENEDGAPKIGDNCVLGAGAKIIGDVTIADDVCIGANAVVVKSILEPHTTWGGVPSKQISNTGGVKYLSKYIQK